MQAPFLGILVVVNNPALGEGILCINVLDFDN